MIIIMIRKMRAANFFCSDLMAYNKVFLGHLESETDGFFSLFRPQNFE